MSTSSSDTPPPSGMVITYSEDTTEAAAEAMEEFLQRPPGQSVSSSFRPLAAVLGGIRAKRRGRKKGRKFSENDVTTYSGSPLESQRGGGGSAPSSPHLQSREPDGKARHRGQHGGHGGVFRRAKGSLLSHLRSHDESSEVVGERSDVPESPGHHSQSESHGEEKGQRRRRQNSAPTDEDYHQPRLQISSPLTRDWSGSELRNEELQSLVQPPPAAWTKTGFLWLRMQHENRYAWTPIVSVYILPSYTRIIVRPYYSVLRVCC